MEARLCPTEPRRAAYVLAAELNARNVRIGYTAITGWFRRQFDQKRGLFKPKQFRLVIETLFNNLDGQPKPTPQELVSLARCAGDAFFYSLNEDWALELLGMPLPLAAAAPVCDARYPNSPRLVERRDLWDALIPKVRTCLMRREPLVVFGAPGTGKTTLVQSIETQWQNSSLPHLFPDGLRLAHFGGGEADVWLRDWASGEAGSLPMSVHPAPALVKWLRARWQSKRLLLVLDDVAQAHAARLLMLANPAAAVTVLTTYRRDVAHALAVSEACLWELPGFSVQQAAELSAGWQHAPSPVLLERLTRRLRGNPLAMQFAWRLARQLAWDWELLLDLLNPEVMAFPESFLHGVYLPQMRLYEAVFSPELREKVRALGGLAAPGTYRSGQLGEVWQCNAKMASFYAYELRAYGWLDRLPHSRWHVSGWLIGFARHIR